MTDASVPTVAAVYDRRLYGNSQRSSASGRRFKAGGHRPPLQWGHCFLCLLALTWSAPAVAQSLEAYNAEIHETANGYQVALDMRFNKAVDVRFSILENVGTSLAQRVSDCNSGGETSGDPAFSGQLFPATHTRITSECGLVRLSYEVPKGSRVPLLTPDIKLDRKGSVTLAATGNSIRGRDVFPRLEWSADGVGRRQMKHLPSVMIFDVPEGPKRSSAAGGFGFRFYGFFVCAVVFLSTFFLWVRYRHES
jgi:hypothetical protein